MVIVSSINLQKGFKLHESPNQCVTQIPEIVILQRHVFGKHGMLTHRDELKGLLYLLKMLEISLSW